MELLIVIVVIGILAAISVVAYNGITNSANDAAVKSDLANIAKKVEMYQVEKGYYPRGTPDLETLGMKVTKSAYDIDRILNFSYCNDSGRTGSLYAIGAISKSGRRFFVSSASPVSEYTSTNNDGNESVGNLQCSSLLSGAVRAQAGWYSETTPQWRAWTGAN